MSSCPCTQGRVIYEEPGSSAGLALARDGGAVLLTQPDGTTQLVLLTPDQQRQVAAAEAWKAETPALESQIYSVRNCYLTVWSATHSLAITGRCGYSQE